MSNNHKQKLLIIPSWYPQYKGDIGGIFFREQALALAKRNYSVSIIYPQIRTLRDFRGVFFKKYGYQYFIDEGIKTYKWHSVNFIPKSKKTFKEKWIKTGLYLFKKYMEENGLPDIIHVHSMRYGGFLALEIKKKYGVPYVVTEHSSAYAMNLVTRYELKQLKSIVNNSSYNIAVSERFCELLNNLFKTNTWKYIPNIVNDSFLSLPLSQPKPNLEFTLLTICALKKNKSVDILIRAFKIFNEKYPYTDLIIGGNGPEYYKILELIEELNLSKKVKLLGELSRSDVKSNILDCSVFILPSKYETFGVVLIEALALGKPVIATKSGGPESIVNIDVGLLAEVDNVQSLSSTIEQIYKNYNSYNSHFIRSYCYDNFSEDAVISKLENIYSRFK